MIRIANWSQRMIAMGHRTQTFDVCHVVDLKYEKESAERLTRDGSRTSRDVGHVRRP